MATSRKSASARVLLAAFMVSRARTPSRSSPPTPPAINRGRPLLQYPS